MIENLDGNWISGFTDGEGCFKSVCVKNEQYKNHEFASISFEIGLRADDKDILYGIQKYFGCGKIYFYSKHTNHPYDKPIIRFSVQSFKECYHKVIPQFIKFPLRSKKLRDFEIWKEAVEFCYHKQHLENFEYYKYLCNKLKGIRKFIPEILDKFNISKPIHQLDLSFENEIKNGGIQ